MASTVSKKRLRSSASRSSRAALRKPAPMDAAQMKQLIKEAVREALEESRADEQDEEEWTRQFAHSQDALDKMAETVREQIRTGKTEQLDPARL